MTRIVTLVCVLVVVCQGAANPELDRILKGVESRYNRAKTLKVLFREAYTASGRPHQVENGELILRKPGRMRWDYSQPQGKLFLSDGKDVYLYTPDGNRVERMKLKESEDMRAPLAFLLGKLDFAKEFKNIGLRADGGDFRITAEAKDDKLPYAQIEMLVSPAFTIKHLVVHGQDQSILTFDFDREELNPVVNDRIFQFQMPAGATLVSGGN